MVIRPPPAKSEESGREAGMARYLFRRAEWGRRLVRGEWIRSLQTALRDAGIDPGPGDGIFGPATEAALRAWQIRRVAPVTGAVTPDDWVALTGTAPPTLRVRALQLTADFEGHGFGKVRGDFDGAGLTWGIIGFTLHGGGLVAVLRDIRARDPRLLHRAFGPRTAALMAMLDGDDAARRSFVAAVSPIPGQAVVDPLWAGSFARLGSLPDVQEIQLRHVARYWRVAARDARHFRLRSELGFALCFDIAVQNGGIAPHLRRCLKERLKTRPSSDERTIRRLIADGVAAHARARFAADVRARKRTIAAGLGVVHGARYRLADWGLSDLPIVDDRPERGRHERVRWPRRPMFRAERSGPRV